MDHLILSNLVLSKKILSNLGLDSISADSYAIFSSLILLITLVVAIRGWRKHRLLPPSPIALPVIGHLHLLSPLVHQSFRKISLKYGPLFSLQLGSLRCIVASSPDVTRELLKGNELTFSSRRQSIAIKRLTHDSALAFVPYGNYWKFVNKLVVNNLLNPRALAQFLPIRNEELYHLVKVLARRTLLATKPSPSVVNVTQELLKLGSNIICHMMFGIRCSDTEGQADEARALVREVTQIFGEFNVADFIWIGKGLDCLTGYNGRVEDIYRRYDSLLESIITDREDLRRKKRELGDNINNGDHVRDFLDILLDAMEDESSEIKVTRKMIKALIMDFLTAATDTSAISIEWSLVELINNPRVLSKAQEEIDQVVGRDRLVAESDVPNLPYVQAIIKETYRLHPPVPLLIRQSTQNCTVNDYAIPEDTLLFANVWAMGRDPSCWESPMDYMPERFDSTGPTGFMELKGQNYQLLPFGSGRRGCPGINLALQLVPTMVAAMIQCFEWEVPARAIDGLDRRLDVTERPGMTAPRAHDLICRPVPKFDLSKIIGDMCLAGHLTMVM